MKIVKMLIGNNAKFHFGDAAGSLKERFSSDQLVSALMNNVVLLYGKKEVNEFISLLKEDRVRFSSLLYGLEFLPKQNQKRKTTIYFLPRPKVDFISINEKYTSSYKEIKKITYVSLGLYRKLSSYWNELEEKCEIDFVSIVLIGKTFAVLREELEELELEERELKSLKFLQVNIKPGVEVGRIENHSENYYFQEDLEFIYNETSNYMAQPFMYFFFEGELPVYLYAAINLLSDEGIGGRRSLGKGFFQGIEYIDSFQQLPKEGCFYMNLSTYFPKKEEVSQLYSYDLEKRNGFVYSLGGTNVRKKSAMMISEGSLMKRKVQGQLSNVQPNGFDHPVYLYGKPIRFGFGGEKV
jgi:CRISPR-associated protein Csm4